MATSETFIVGQVVRLRVTFTLLTGALVDPDAVTVKVKDPSGAATTFDYPTDVVKESTGVYHLDLPVTDSGGWVWQWVSTGTGAAVSDPGTFVAVPQAVA